MAKFNLTLNEKKKVVNKLKGFLKQEYDFSNSKENERAYNDLNRMFTVGSQRKIEGLWINVHTELGLNK